LYKKILAGLVLSAAFVGTSVAEKITNIEAGPIKIQIARSDRSFAFFFSGTLNAVAEDGKDDIAEALNQSIVASGFKHDRNDPTILYRVIELYAGPASQYVPPEPKSKPVIGQGTLNVATSLLTCLVVGGCGDPGVLFSSFSSDSNISNFYDHSKEVNTSDYKGDQHIDPLLSIEKICRVGTSHCGMSVAFTRNTSISLDQLRISNAKNGLVRAINVVK
jgi:hypothetical protein